MIREEARALAEKELSPRRFDHCIRVAEMAEELSNAFAVDTEKCVLAALLHDYVKEWSIESLLEAGRVYEIDCYSMKHPALLHAPVAACLLKDQGLIEDPEVLEAIACHTIGAPGMGTVAQVVYIADYLEAGRPYRKDKEIKESQARGLTAMALYVCAQKLSFMIRREAFVHPWSFELYSELWSKESEGTH